MPVTDADIDLYYPGAGGKSDHDRRYWENYLLKLLRADIGGTPTIDLVVGMGGTSLSTGIVAAADINADFAFTIVQWTLLADASGSMVVDIWKDTYANYPPTVADTITAAAKPTISAATKGQSSTLTGWTTAIAAGSTLRFNVDSVSGINAATLILKVTKTS